MLAGEIVKDMPGVVSKHDSPDRVWQSAALPHDMDALGFPTYDWADIHLYRTYTGFQGVPLLLSRGLLV